MLKEVTILQWFFLVFSILLFIGPGISLCSFLRHETKYRFSLFFLMTFVLSIAFWTILLVYFRFFKINLLNHNFVYLISIFSWIIGVIKFIKLSKNRESQFLLPDKWEILLIFGLIISLLINTYALRNMVVGLGSDSNHHTLITYMFIWNEGLPNNYSPAYPDIITFNYHFGFHALAANLSLLSGWEPRLMVLVLAPILITLSGLATAYFCWRVFQSSIAMALAGIIPSLIAVFPTAMLEWGRYPQTLGLIILSVFLAEYLVVQASEVSKRKIVALSAIASGLALTHYRVTIMGILAILLWEFIRLIEKKSLIAFFGERGLLIGGVSVFSVFLVWPWFLQVYLNQFVGYADPYSAPTELFFSIDRLGSTTLEYPTNISLIGAFALFSLWAIYRRNRLGAWIFLWMFMMLISSWLTRGLKYTAADTITVITSSYLPLSIMIGWGVSDVEKLFSQKIVNGILGTIGVIALVWGAYHMNGLLDVPSAAYVKPEDLKAAEWIRQNTPEDACFMINTYRFEFSTNFIIGSDAGGWLPVLAQRCVVTYPMTSNIERFDHPSALDKVVRIHNLDGKLTSKGAIDLFGKFNIKYVYVRQNEISERINATTLSQSILYERVYSRDNVEIYKIKINTAISVK
ncbi:hypothetical protein BECAL_00639 [Bellilinea caldifistulae]|uniref:Glycosyltransferase RgtA/B/C/D-like domain-containing protein n=1 Tax=Bellilinea caldifistulae TaxID=360411 RepID=A0A0P6WQI2_9CHLR|nr:hypothetical protein [Bellilinea caldifistulae]KPL72310.1 hypothetical protein AC812_15855 [Bellilinea caldifistulae]GAP09495.1 hypothetical protein BECAL_00639 [Bellilinea caldifistulae]